MHQLAAKIGTTHSYISQLERDQIRPGIDLVIRLADAFDVSIDYMVGRAETASRTLDPNRLSESSADYVVGQDEAPTTSQATPSNPVLTGIQDDLLEIAAHDPAALEYIAPIVRAIKEKAVLDHQEQKRGRRAKNHKQQES